MDSSVVGYALDVFCFEAGAQQAEHRRDEGVGIPSGQTQLKSPTESAMPNKSLQPTVLASLRYASPAAELRSYTANVDRIARHPDAIDSHKR